MNKTEITTVPRKTLEERVSDYEATGLEPNGIKKLMHDYTEVMFLLFMMKLLGGPPSASD